jgi:P27 family predicted phage terminase small subunit
MPGPKPTPTSTLALRGSWRAKTREGEPQPEAATDIKPPRNFPKAAKAVWRSLAPQLQASGLLTVADIPTFARYCRTYVAWQEAMTAVEAEGSRENVLTLAKLDEMVRKLEANFGMSPSDRTGIRVDKPSNDDRARFFAD